MVQMNVRNRRNKEAELKLTEESREDVQINKMRRGVIQEQVKNNNKLQKMKKKEE